MNENPSCGLRAYVTTDGVVYDSQVCEIAAWRPILIFVPIRLGLDKVNPVYYPSIKVNMNLLSIL